MTTMKQNRPYPTFTRRDLLGAAGTLALTNGAAPSWCSPADTITVEAGFYTLAEIAKLLSAEGDTIRCASAIRSRAVLLALRNRPREVVRKALCETLGLTLTPISDRVYQWSLDPDLEVTAREQAWCDAYADRATVALETYLARVEQCIDGRTYVQWRTESESHGRTPPGTASPTTGPATPQSITSADAQHERREWYRKRLFLDALLHPGFWLAARRLQRRPPDLRRIIRASAQSTSAGSAGVRLLPFSPKAVLEGIPGDQIAATEFAALHDTLVERAVFDPLRQTFTFQIATLFYSEAEVKNDFVFPCNQGSLEALFAALGADASTYLAESRARTEAFFALPALKRLVPLPEGDGESLSATLLAWCRETGTEIVAEIQPLRDHFVAPANGSRFRLADLSPRVVRANMERELARVKAIGLFPDGAGEVLEHGANATEDNSAWPLPPERLGGERESLGDLMYWDFHMGEDNLLRVTDRLAFLDRAYDLPMDLPLALWRRRETRRTDRTGPETLPTAPFNWQELYGILTSPAAWNTTGWIRLGIEGHWGFPLRQMAKVIPFLHLLTRAGRGPQGDVWETLEAHGRLVLPVAACGPDAGAWIADALRRQGFWCANAFHTRFAAMVQTSHFMLLRDKTPIPDYGDDPPPPGTPRASADLLTVDIHDLTCQGRRTEWDLDDPHLIGFWLLPRDLPMLLWSPE